MWVIKRPFLAILYRWEYIVLYRGNVGLLATDIFHLFFKKCWCGCIFSKILWIWDLILVSYYSFWQEFDAQVVFIGIVFGQFSCYRLIRYILMTYILTVLVELSSASVVHFIDCHLVIFCHCICIFKFLWPILRCI